MKIKSITIELEQSDPQKPAIVISRGADFLWHFPQVDFYPRTIRLLDEINQLAREHDSGAK